MGSDVDRKTLYVRLPCRIQDAAQIQDLHPDIKIVKFGRQKSNRWCHIRFESESVCEQVLVALKKTEVNGKKLFVEYARPLETSRAQRKEKAAARQAKNVLRKLEKWETKVQSLSATRTAN